MAMTKKHFTAIAKVINDALWDDKNDAATTMQIAGRLAVFFQQENPLFDHERFIAACVANRDTVSQTGDAK